jgi:branched-chain amino acid transport system permease protein
LALQLMLFPMPLGGWLVALVSGLLTGLVAMGLALIHRANRVVNFAQADLGAVPAALTLALVGITGVPYLIAVGLGIAAAAVVGVVVEFLVIRRLLASSRLLVSVATIGVSQVLTVAALLLPRWWGRQTLVDLRLAAPLSWRLQVGTQVLGSAELLAGVVAVVMLLALGWFLQRTDLGVAIRAAAGRPELAALLGIPVRRLNSVVWATAAVLSYVGLVLGIGIFGYAGITSLGPAALLFALGALALGRFDHLPAVVGSAVGLRLVAAGVERAAPNHPTRAYLAVALVILVVLLVRRAEGARRRQAPGWSGSDGTRPLPAEVRGQPAVIWVRRALLGVVIASAVAVPWGFGPSNLLRASSLMVAILVTLSVVVLAGWSGQVSLGQLAFVSVGAAVGAVVTHRWGWDLGAALVLGALVSAAVAVLVGLPTLRFPGMVLAVTTLAFSVAASNYLLNRSEQSWIPDVRLERAPLFGIWNLESERTMYLTSLGVVLAVIVALERVRRSAPGRAQVASRDNPTAAGAFGIPVLWTRVGALALSGALAGLAGALGVHVDRGFTETAYVAPLSLAVFSAAVVGGLASIGGAVAGAAVFLGGRWFLPPAWQLLPTAAGTLAVLLAFPRGLAGVGERVRDRLLQRFAARRGIRIPALEHQAAEPNEQLVAAVRIPVRAPGSADVTP